MLYSALPYPPPSIGFQLNILFIPGGVVPTAYNESGHNEFAKI